MKSFVFLARKGDFDGQLCFRDANSIDAIQAGDPTCLGPRIDDCARDVDGGPGYTIPDETFNRLDFEVGTLAMANAGPGTAGSQFFLITGDLGLQLPPNYTVFGKIVEGLDIAREIQSVPVGEEGTTEAETPTELAYIESVTISVRE
ncbi:MAG: peptidylprolyl isomerase [Actinobacteria bacterium]|nr:peptidylprolyl isomerase [Actinomycetota bacterium]